MKSADRGPVLVLPFAKAGSSGYDLAVTSAQASVQDYLAALEEAVRRLPLTRTRNPAAARCLGCTACCAERIPLTVVDYHQLTRRTSLDLLPRIAALRHHGPSVDVMLRRTPGGRCLFLDVQTGLCRVYRVRPFVCRTYICCPVSRRAAELREAVTNAGEDELVRLWLAKEPSPPGVSRADWPPGAFTAKWSYREVNLRDCVSASLWRRLYQPKRGTP